MRLRGNKLRLFLKQSYKLLEGTEYQASLRRWDIRRNDEKYLTAAAVEYLKVLYTASFSDPSLREEAKVLAKSAARGSPKKVR